MADLVLATRGSALAMAQTRAVIRALESHHPGIEVEPLIVTTGGDEDRTTPVTELTELGAFVRAVQAAVLDGRAGAAVHSCKDLPVEGPDGLTACYPLARSPGTSCAAPPSRTSQRGRAWEPAARAVPPNCWRCDPISP